MTFFPKRWRSRANIVLFSLTNYFNSIQQKVSV